MGKIKVRFASNNYGGPSPLEVPESDIDRPEGLEKFFGFGEYKKGINSGNISKGDTIEIPNGFHNPDQSIFYNWETFLVENEKTLRRYPEDSISWNPRKELKGIHWYLTKQ